MGYPKISEASGYLKVLEKAREIDPSAFEGFSMTHFTDDQLIRQHTAIGKASEIVKSTS